MKHIRRGWAPKDLALRNMDPVASFPTFKGWSRSKLFYANNMSVVQEKSNHELIVVSEAYRSKFSRCAMCSERFAQTFDTSLEEWVYKGCKELNGVPYHFPLCWEYAHDQ